MSDPHEHSTSEDSNSGLDELLRKCANIQSLESLCQLVDYDYNDVYLPLADKMISPSPCSVSGTASNTNSSNVSEESFTDNLLEENGRISLAYENLRTIPRNIADKFAAQTKCLDLSHNNFHNLTFLSFFEELNTLILDRNLNLNVSTLPYLPNLTILWINNCNISNIIDWIHRIERQCPLLEHLSLMGNPGIKTIFGSKAGQLGENNQHQYILQVLPNLKYLDGVPRCAIMAQNLPIQGCPNNMASSSCTSVHDQEYAKVGDKRKQSCKCLKAASPTLSFKDFFRLNTRKKSHYSHCYYSGGYANGNGSSTN